MRLGHSTEVHEAQAPAPESKKELVHISAEPHRGKFKVHAHIMEGGNLTKHEHVVPDQAAAHAQMGQYMQAEPVESAEKEGEAEGAEA